MKKILIPVLLLSTLASNLHAEGFVQMGDSTKVVKLATIKKAPADNRAIDVKTGEKLADDEVKKSVPAVTTSIKPTFPGGEKAIRDFVRTTMKYPKECEAEALAGRVTVTMTIATDGTPYDIKILRGSGNKFMDAEALRVAKLMPKWNSVKEEENAEETTYMLPIVFRPTKNVKR